MQNAIPGLAFARTNLFNCFTYLFGFQLHIDILKFSMSVTKPAWLQAIVNEVDIEPSQNGRDLQSIPKWQTRDTKSNQMSFGPHRKDLVCNHCGKMFRRVCNYREHQRVHSNEYKFSCTVEGCGRKFMWRSSIQAHNRSHEAKLHRIQARSMIGKSLHSRGTMKIKLDHLLPKFVDEKAEHLNAHRKH